MLGTAQSLKARGWDVLGLRTQSSGATSLEEGASGRILREQDPSIKADLRSATWSEAAFRDLYLEYYGRVVGILLRLVGGRAEAEELANEVFWKLYRNRFLPDPAGNVGGWLYRTATHLGIDALRSAGRRRLYEAEAGRRHLEPAKAAGPLDDLLRSEERSRVRLVLAQLRPAQAQILILRHSGFSYKELAETLGVAGGSVGTMLMRAEAEFERRYLEMYGKEGL